MLHLGHQLPDAIGCRHGVRTWQLISGNDGAWLAVQASYNAIILGTQFQTRDIPHAHGPAVGSFTYYDLSKFLRRRQAALREDRVGKFLALRRRFATRFPSRVYGVLRLNRADNLGDSDAQLCQLIRFHPQPHRILSGAENLDVAYARRTRNRIADIDIRVVRQKLGIVGSMGGVEGNQHERGRHGFADGNPVVVHVGGELRGSLCLTRLGQNQIGVRICFHIEVDDQRRIRIAGGIQRIHVIHVVHAAHLLFDGSGHRLLERLRVRANVGGKNLNFRRSDVGKLRDRQTKDSDGANKHQDNGDHHCDDGTVDKEF